MLQKKVWVGSGAIFGLTFDYHLDDWPIYCSEIKFRARLMKAELPAKDKEDRLTLLSQSGLQHQLHILYVAYVEIRPEVTGWTRGFIILYPCIIFDWMSQQSLNRAQRPYLKLCLCAVMGLSAVSLQATCMLKLQFRSNEQSSSSHHKR